MDFRDLNKDLNTILKDSRSRGLKISGAGMVVVSLAVLLFIMLSESLGRLVLVIGIVTVIAGLLMHFVLLTKKVGKKNN